MVSFFDTYISLWYFKNMNVDKQTNKNASSLINVPETIMQNFVSDVFGNPTGWLLDIIMEYFYE